MSFQIFKRESSADQSREEQRRKKKESDQQIQSCFFAGHSISLCLLNSSYEAVIAPGTITIRAVSLKFYSFEDLELF